MRNNNFIKGLSAACMIVLVNTIKFYKCNDLFNYSVSGDLINLDHFLKNDPRSKLKNFLIKMLATLKIATFVKDYSKRNEITYEKVDNFSYILTLKGGSKRYLTSKHKDNVLWSKLEEFSNLYDNINVYFQRVIGNYRLFSALNIGPLFYEYNIIDEKILIIITEYLPSELTKEITENNYDTIKNWIKRIHDMGIFHGDLHGGNIRFNSSNELRMIDLETVFYKDELDNQIILEWVEEGFDMDLTEFIEHEEVYGFKIISVDDD